MRPFLSHVDELGPRQRAGDRSARGSTRARHRGAGTLTTPSQDENQKLVRIGSPVVPSQPPESKQIFIVYF